MIEMNSIMEIIKEFEKPCSCGREHRTSVQDVQIGSGLVKKVGEILKKNGFPKDILLVADKNILRGFVLKFEDAALTGCSEKSSRFERDKFTGYFLHHSLKP